MVGRYIPRWDPRVRLGCAAHEANHLRQQYARQSQRPMAGYAMAQADPSLLGDDEFDGLYGNISQKNGYLHGRDRSQSWTWHWHA